MQYNLFNTPVVHAKENNAESQKHLENLHGHFTGKCLELLKRLCNGERLMFCDEVYTIGDLRRRSKDLIESGIPVQRTFIPCQKIKEYWLKPEDIEWIKKKYLPEPTN